MPNPSTAPRRRFKGRTRSPMTGSKPITEEKKYFLYKKWTENELNNFHSENVLLMAESVGTAADIKKAKKIIADRNKAGYLPPEAYQAQMALNKKLYPKFFGRTFGKPFK